MEGASIGLLLGFVAAVAAVSRLYWVGAAALACGLLGRLTRADSAVANLVIFGAISVGLFLTGGMTLSRFLREQTPAASLQHGG